MPRTTLRVSFLCRLAILVILCACNRAIAGYSGDLSVAAPTISYGTNSAGLTDYRYATINWSMSKGPSPNSEGISGWRCSGYMQIGGTSTPLAFSGDSTSSQAMSISLQYGAPSYSPSSPYQTGAPVYVHITWYTWNTGGSGSGEFQYDRDSPTVYLGNNQNTLGTASYTFDPTSFNCDAATHGYGYGINITISPANAGVQFLSGTPYSSQAGNYSFVVGPTNPDFQGSSTCNWSINKGNLTPPTSSSSTAQAGSDWSPPFAPPFAAPPDGGYTWCVATRTNWGDDHWFPAVSDVGQSFSFYVAVYGPATEYNGVAFTQRPGMVLAYSGPYQVTVTPPPYSPPTGSLTANPASISFGNSSTLSGSYTLGNGESLVRVCINEGGSTLTEGTSLTVAPTVGSHTYTLYVASTHYPSPIAVASATVTVGKGNQTNPVWISPTTATVTVGSNISFAAGGGNGTGAYIWGGDASGTGTGQSVTFNTIGTRTVSVYHAGDANYNDSAWATATITVIPLVPGNLGLTAGSTDFGSAYRDSLAGNPTSTTRTFTVTNTGGQSLTITAISTTGNFSVTASPGLPLTVTGGNSTSITVTFTPGSSIGTNNGSLNISTTANNLSLALTGTGLAPKISISWH